ncbi:hypothetical protein BST61_g6669 [Cercospora zeina]
MNRQLIFERYSQGYAKFLQRTANDELIVRVHNPPPEPTVEQRIRNLSQELQDMILDYTLLVEPSTVTITDTYRPPWQLSVNRRTRPIVAQHFYSTSTFNDNTALKNLEHWLDSLPEAQIPMLTKVDFGVRSLSEAKKWLTIYTQSLEDQFRIVLAPGVLRAWFTKKNKHRWAQEWVYVSWKDAAALEDREMRGESFYGHSQPWEGREEQI